MYPYLQIVSNLFRTKQDIFDEWYQYNTSSLVGGFKPRQQQWLTLFKKSHSSIACAVHYSFDVVPSPPTSWTLSNIKTTFGFLNNTFYENKTQTFKYCTREHFIRTNFRVLTKKLISEMKAEAPKTQKQNIDIYSKLNLRYFNLPLKSVYT